MGPSSRVLSYSIASVFYLQELFRALSGSGVSISGVVGAAGDNEQVVAEAGEGTHLIAGVAVLQEGTILHTCLRSTVDAVAAESTTRKLESEHQQSHVLIDAKPLCIHVLIWSRGTAMVSHACTPVRCVHNSYLADLSCACAPTTREYCGWTRW